MAKHTLDGHRIPVHINLVFCIFHRNRGNVFSAGLCHFEGKNTPHLGLVGVHWVWEIGFCVVV